MMERLLKELTNKPRIVNQGDRKTCSVCCLAMAYGVTEADVLEDMLEYGIDAMDGGVSTDEFEYYLNMNRQGFEKTYPSSLMGFYGDSSVIITKLSKSTPEVYHDILMYNYNGHIMLFDPMEYESELVEDLSEMVIVHFTILKDYSNLIPSRLSIQL